MKTTFLWAGVFGLTAIALGALGTHSLKAILSPSQLDSFEVGVRYQMYHTFFLLFIGVLQITKPNLGLISVRNLTVIGIFGFSLSIYLLTMQTPWSFSIPFLWAITPLGGIVLMSAWLLFLVKIMLLTKDA